MYEIVLKVPADLEPVRGRLRDREHVSLGTVTQSDTYFDHPERSFAETDEAVRVRREQAAADGEQTVTVTYKGPLVETRSKTREELEVTVSDAGSMEAILAALGFTPVSTVRKTRERYRIGEYTVSLDRVTDLGEFVEVETVGSAETLDRKRSEAASLLRSLGVDPEAQVRTSYLELLIES